jgi:hypothetical protein
MCGVSFMKKVFCMIAANGSGKTAIIKKLIHDHRWFRIKVYGDETWDVIAPPWVKGNLSPDDKAIIVGAYANRKIGGGDCLERKEFWKAMRAASIYRGANNIIVEALKISSPEFYRQLERFCKNSDFTLHTTLIHADPITCFKRQMKRAAKNATYPLATVFMRHTRAKYLYQVIPESQKSWIENGNPGEFNAAVKKYLEIVFPKPESDLQIIANGIMIPLKEKK